jgi:hypothetical protein
MSAQKFRKVPVVIEAIRYDGSNHDEINTWTGGRFHQVDAEDRGDDPDITAQVLDVLHSTWVGVKDGQWVIRGVQGEFYPCDATVFGATYEPVGDAA